MNIELNHNPDNSFIIKSKVMLWSNVYSISLCSLKRQESSSSIEGFISILIDAICGCFVYCDENSIFVLELEGTCLKQIFTHINTYSEY